MRDLTKETAFIKQIDQVEEAQKRVATSLMLPEIFKNIEAEKKRQKEIDVAAHSVDSVSGNPDTWEKNEQARMNSFTSDFAIKREEEGRKGAEQVADELQDEAKNKGQNLFTYTASLLDNLKSARLILNHISDEENENLLVTDDEKRVRNILNLYSSVGISVFFLLLWPLGIGFLLVKPLYAFIVSLVFLPYTSYKVFGESHVKFNDLLSRKDTGSLTVKDLEVGNSSNESSPAFGGFGDFGGFGGFAGTEYNDENTDISQPITIMPEWKKVSAEKEEGKTGFMIKQGLHKPTIASIREKQVEMMKEILEDPFKEMFAPKDILERMSPMIPSNSPDSGRLDDIEHDETEFKNIAFVIAEMLREGDTSFAKKNNLEKEYYFLIDSMKRNPAFYKVVVDIPRGYSMKKFKTMGPFAETLLRDDFSEDKAQVSIEPINASRAIVKFFRFPKNYGLGMGDVLRSEDFKLNGKTVAELLTDKKADLPFIGGLKNWEKPFIIDVGRFQNGHWSVFGQSGSGKSVAVGSEIGSNVLTTAPGNVYYFILDYKDTPYWDNFAKLPHVLGRFGSKDLLRYTEILKSLNDIKTNIQASFTEKGASDMAALRSKILATGDFEKLTKEGSRVVIIVDEINATFGALEKLDKKEKKSGLKSKELSKFKDGFEGALNDFGQTARSAGVHVVAIGQQPEEKYFSVPFRDASSIKFGMRLAAKSMSKVFEGYEIDTENFSAGQGYFKDNGNKKITLISVPPLAPSDDGGELAVLLDELTNAFSYIWRLSVYFQQDLKKKPDYLLFDKLSKDQQKLLFRRDKIDKDFEESMKQGKIFFGNEVREDMKIDIAALREEYLKNNKIPEKFLSNFTNGKTIEYKEFDIKKDNPLNKPEFREETGKPVLEKEVEKMVETPVEITESPIEKKLVDRGSYNDIESKANNKSEQSINKSSNADISIKTPIIKEKHKVPSLSEIREKRKKEARKKEIQKEKENFQNNFSHMTIEEYIKNKGTKGTDSKFSVASDALKEVFSEEEVEYKKGLFTIFEADDGRIYLD